MSGNIPNASELVLELRSNFSSTPRCVLCVCVSRTRVVAGMMRMGWSSNKYLQGA